MTAMWRRAALVGLAWLAAASAASAQSFPDHKPIRMTVMFGPGSAADVIARKLADGMEKALDAPVPVVNRPGGGGAVGYVHVATQKPDGYSIVWNSNSISTGYHQGILEFDYTKFDAVARASVEIPAIVVRANSPWKTLRELVAYAKENPGKVRVGNSGFGSHTHFASVALFGTVGAKVIDVPFNGNDAVTDLLGGRIEAAVQLPAAFIAYVKNGDLRVLAALGSVRDPVYPEVSTARELGYDVALDMWRGIAVPKGTPAPVIATLEAAVKKAVESPDFAAAGTRIGFKPAFLPHDQFAALIASDDARLAKLMADLGMKKQ
ncbi:MAG TPA: tripartite tricarboxylate transporter substrate binding protein [Alphaproteobacteria bacterium]|nr:tripartite tricarboxylate transporter substrate binding protein [Alphaproteobacteria bacterium]